MTESLFSAGRLSFRVLRDSDVDLVAGWRSDSAVARWYGADSPRDPTAFRAKYLANPARSHITHCVVSRDGCDVGFVQFYRCDDSYKTAAGVPLAENAWAIDVHLAPERMGQGLGPRVVRVAAEHLRNTHAARVLIDPEVDNARAIRAYEKAGFVPLRVARAYSQRDGVPRDNLLMEYRPAHADRPRGD